MRPYVLLFLICIFLGVITTIGVAWSLATWVEYTVAKTAWGGSEQEDNQAKLIILEGYGSECVVVDTPSPSQKPDKTVTGSSVFQWSELLSYGDSSGIWLEEARGWPALALYRRQVGTQTDWIQTLEDGIEISDRQLIFPTVRSSKSNTQYRIGLYINRVLPYGIYWPGFIINTLIYAVIWLFIFLTISKIKNKYRTKQGHCPACNYNLRNNMESGCPECGWNRNPLAPASGGR